MFDLNQAIQSWRTAAPRTVPADLDQQESLIRQQFAQLTAAPQPLSEHEAFLVASARLGHPESLAREFAKANPWNLWRNRLFWMAAGVVVWPIFHGLTRLLAFTASFIASEQGLTNRNLGLFTLAVNALAYVAALASIYLIFRAPRTRKFLSNTLSHPLRCPLLLAALLAILLAIMALYTTYLAGFAGYNTMQTALNLLQPQSPIGFLVYLAFPSLPLIVLAALTWPYRPPKPTIPA